MQTRSVSVQAVRRNPGANSGLKPSNSLTFRASLHQDRFTKWSRIDSSGSHKSLSTTWIAERIYVSYYRSDFLHVGDYPPSQKTTGLPVDECANNQYATARCRPEAEADNRVVAEDGYFSGTTGLPVGLHNTL